MCQFGAGHIDGVGQIAVSDQYVEDVGSIADSGLASLDSDPQDVGPARMAGENGHPTCRSPFSVLATVSCQHFTLGGGEVPNRAGLAQIVHKSGRRSAKYQGGLPEEDRKRFAPPWEGTRHVLFPNTIPLSVQPVMLEPMSKWPGVPALAGWKVLCKRLSTARAVGPRPSRQREYGRGWCIA